MGTIIRLPEAVHAAYNPIIVEIEDTVDLLTIGVRADAGYSLEKELFNGRAVFDLSPILKRCFNDSISNPGNKNWFVDNNLVTNYTAKIAGITYPFTALNAVRQIGESSDMSGLAGHFLTSFERLKYYPSYDTQICALSYVGGTYFNFDSDIKTFAPISNSTFCFWLADAVYAAISNTTDNEIYLTTEGNESITNTLGEIIQIISAGGELIERRMPIDTCCIPDNPFYVRWINTMGGWDYWMFSTKQAINNSISDAVEFTPYSDDMLNSTNTSEIISATPKKVITVGAEQLTNNEYDVISQLIYSPKIQYYNSITNKWVGLLLNDAEVEKNTNEFKQALEFKFIMPQPQIQL